MTTEQRSAAARQRLVDALETALPGPGWAKPRRIILGAVSDYTAAMIELCARPPEETWGPAKNSDEGSGAA